MADEILAMSSRADFYPGLGEDQDIEDYEGDRILWTFALPRDQEVGAGIYRIQFVRTLADEKALGNPLGLSA